MFIQIKNIWYYNVYIHKLKLSIKYFNLNITVTSILWKDVVSAMAILYSFDFEFFYQLLMIL